MCSSEPHGCWCEERNTNDYPKLRLVFVPTDAGTAAVLIDSNLPERIRLVTSEFAGPNAKIVKEPRHVTG
jgi:hypothetical protein